LDERWRRRGNYGTRRGLNATMTTTTATTECLTRLPVCTLEHARWTRSSAYTHQGAPHTTPACRPLESVPAGSRGTRSDNGRHARGISGVSLPWFGDRRLELMSNYVY